MKFLIQSCSSVLFWAAAFLSALSAQEIQRAADAPQPLSPEASAAKVRVPDGFRLELVASEPLIQEPSCVAFDEYGRMFVTELHGYNVEGELDVAELNKTGKLDMKVRRLRWEFMGGDVAEKAKQLQYGKVKLLSDTDGDGRMDTAEVWADDLPAAYGVIPARGGIIVVAAPDIVFLKDNNGDGKPDERETLFTGFHKREMERGINNPRRGPDNWIYVGAGGHGGRITGPHLKEAVDLHHSDFRIKADGSAIEPVTGRVGTFGLAMNGVGDRFPCSGGQPAIYALPLDYKMLTRNPWVETPSMNYNAANYGNGFRISEPHPWRVRRRQNPAWIKFYGNRETDSNYFTGGCGGEIYNADLFAEEYRGDFFYCEPSLNIVHRCKLTRDGAGYKARRAKGEETSEFLASRDQWFRPMNLRVGPDGAMYIVDMYREIIEDYSAIPRFLQQQYGLDRGRNRGRIWRLVPEGKRQGKSLETYALLRGDADSQVSANQIRALLASENLWQRLAAQRVILESDAEFDFDVPQLLDEIVANSTSATAVIHALHILNELDGVTKAQLTRALRHADWRVRTHGLKLLAESSHAHSMTEFLSTLISDKDPRVRLEVPFACRDNDTLLQLAKNHGDERWMNAAILSSVSDPGAMLAKIMEAGPQLPSGAAQLIRPLAATIAGSRNRAAIVKVLVLVPDQPDVAAACLEGLLTGLSRGKETLKLRDRQLSGLVKVLRAKPQSELRILAARVAAKLAKPDSRLATAIFERASKLAIEESEDLATRKNAMLVLQDAPFQVLADLCGELLDSRHPPELQQAAISALGAVDKPKVPKLLLAKWDSHTPAVRKSVTEALFARRNRFSAILDAIESKKLLASDLSAGQQEQLLSDEVVSIASRAKHLLESRSDEVVAERISSYVARLGQSPPNLTSGKSLFAKVCLNCHRLGKEGHAVGPELGSILNKPNAAIVAEILDPSSKIDAEYTSYTVVTHGGKSITGVLASESPTSVTLKMEKGETRTVLRNEIEILRASNVSLMPSNLHEQITAEQMADLLAYIRQAYRTETD